MMFHYDAFNKKVDIRIGIFILIEKQYIDILWGTDTLILKNSDVSILEKVIFDIKMSEIFFIRNLKASKIFRDLYIY